MHLLAHSTDNSLDVLNYVSELAVRRLHGAQPTPRLGVPDHNHIRPDPCSAAAMAGTLSPSSWSGCRSASASLASPQSVAGSKGHAAAAQDSVALLLGDPPPELLCPISHAVFLDPVLTSAGHVYERSYIEAHLARGASTDPLTREPLAGGGLTPVHSIRGRALEYREGTAKACVAAACDPGNAPHAADLLRRAVELVAGTTIALPGLPPDTVDFVSRHAGNVYDRCSGLKWFHARLVLRSKYLPRPCSLCLQSFAAGLLRAGYRDRAAVVYFSLLAAAHDRAEQAALLRCCLACWSQPKEEGDAGGAQAAGGVGDAMLALGPGSDAHALDRLVLLGSEQRTLGWAQLVDLAADAGLGHAFAARRGWGWGR